jgi:CRISPR/Cas system CMR subunit Cmr6 (Cas7 group RAMP superfamily)
MLEKFPFFDPDVDDEKVISLSSILHDGVDLIKERIDHLKKQTSSKNADKARKAMKALNAIDAVSKRSHTAGAASVDPMAWISTLPKSRHRLLTLRTASRLAIGLANGVIENAGITLHRRYGRPMIPGSSLKGVALRAGKRLGFGAADMERIFGREPGEESALAGCVGFLDAFSARSDAKIELDIVNPHYPKYYSGKGNQDAEDTENPIPNFFPAVGRGTEFRFILICTTRRISAEEAARTLDLAAQALVEALTTSGIGAKTGSGYGWFEKIQSLQSGPTAAGSDIFSLEVLNKWKGKGHNKDNFRVMLPELSKCQNTEALEDALPEIVGLQHWRQFRRNHPYWQSFASHPDGRNILDRIRIKLK